MKKIIKWLADISGVTADIEKQTRIDVGHDLNSAKYWWNENKPIMNSWHLAAKYYIQGYYRPPIDTIRKEVYELGNDIHLDIK